MSVKLANYWLKRGHSVTIVCLFSGGPVESQLSSCAQCIYLNCKSIKSSLFPLLYLLRNQSFDFIIARMWPLTIVAIIAWIFSGMKGFLVVSEHTNLSVSARRELQISPLWIKFTMQLFYRYPSRVVAVSRGIADDLVSSFHVNRAKLSVIYNPALDQMATLNKSESFKDNSSLHFAMDKCVSDGCPLRCLSVGSLKEQKNFDVLINAFSEVILEMDARLVIAGDGCLRDSLQDLIYDLNLGSHVSLVGHVDDIYNLYKSSDLFVLSSAWEGFGNVLVEALSYGLPVVSTNCDYGPAEILDFGRYGRLVEPGSSHKLALAILEESSCETSCYDDRIARAKEFSVDAISSQYLRLAQVVKQ